MKSNKLKPGWYTGKSPIIDLFFFHSDIQAILEDAFNTTAFFRLEELYINTTEPIHCIGNILNGMDKLQRLSLITMQLKNFVRNGLAPIRRFVREIKLMDLSNDVNFDDLFGANAQKLGVLGLIAVQFHQLPTAHRLTKSNFSALAGIREISVKHCGIISIAEDTFDIISDTLYNVYLQNNQLVTLPATVFNRIIDSQKSGAAYIKILDNPYDCDCNFFQVIGQLMISSFSLAHYYSMMPCMHSAIPIECASYLQVMHTSKFSLSLISDMRMIHAKFQLKIDFDQRELIIRTMVRDRFRLWIFTGNDYKMKGDQMCPSADWRKTQVRCIILDGRVERIPLHRFVHDLKIISLCVSYVASSRKRFWPLQCIGIFWPDGRKIEWVLIAGNTIVWCGLGFLLGTLICYITWRMRHHQKKMPPRLVHRILWRLN